MQAHAPSERSPRGKSYLVSGTISVMAKRIAHTKGLPL